jgi:hypothetical protein
MMHQIPFIEGWSRDHTNMYTAVAAAVEEGEEGEGYPPLASPRLLSADLCTNLMQ